MVQNFSAMFFEESELVKRYKLKAGLISHIQSFYERFVDYNKIDDDKEVLLPCILVVLQIHGRGIDIRDELMFMAFVFFEKKDMHQRYMNMFENYEKLLDYHLENRW